MEWIETTWGQTDLPVSLLLVREEGCRTVYQNAAAQALCGDCADVLSAMPQQEAAALIAAARGEEAARPPLFCHVGKEVYSAVLLSWEGFRVCLFQEVSEYYSSNRRAMDEAIMASQAKTSFLSEMSHDIRTPMGAIIGLTEIALAQSQVPPKIRECLDKIKVASGHMMSLLNEVLDMSRIESGRVLPLPRETNVADLLHEVLIVAKPQSDAGKLQFHLEVGEIVRERLLVDSVRLKQVFLNLLSNAIKYTPAGGRVELFFAIRAGEEPGRVRMAVQVRDNGIGMSPEFLRKVFDPFEREQKSTVNKIQGTGLGLAITKNLVEMMGGEIHVESEPNVGSCFSMDIPFSAAEGEEDAPEELAGRRVLVLGGEEQQALAACRMLESLGMEADWARDAESAVTFINDAAFSERDYFALLTGERVPGVDLMLLLPELRQRLGSQFPILMLAEGDWSQTEYMFTRAGVDAFIPLPLFRSRLAAELCACARGGKTGPCRPDGRAAYDFSRKRLLLVEDNELNREIATELLGDSGIAIETAENGRQAVDRFSQSALFYYDLILMDIQMPVMNGLDATRAIRALDREDASRVPIVAMTANAFVEDVKNALDAGMDAHISKPLDMDRVLSTMEMFLQGGRG